MCACVYKMSTAAVLLSLVLSLAVSVAVGLDPECGASGWQVPPRPAALTLRQVNAVIRYMHTCMSVYLHATTCAMHVCM